MTSKSYNRPMTHLEYLQHNYMSSSSSDYEKKSKKSKAKSHVKAPTVKILDEDIDFKKLSRGDSDEDEIYFGTKEEKPVVAGVIDERPLSVQAGDVDRRKWKRIGDDAEEQSTSVIDNSHREPSNEKNHKNKTLSGKKAGLSNAKEIKKELEELKRKNEKILKSLSDDVSGRNAKTVFRERGTGKIRNIEKEMAEKAVDEKKNAEKKAVYDKWSKGVVQTEDKEEKLASDLYEMTKPLARYENDSDLDKLLKDRDRADDPMLKEIIKKREADEREKNPNYKEYPKYKGPPGPPNRFNIQPGYRWDGVDRSNGYEAKLFSRAANQEATQEEAYRWSTQDM